MVFWGANPAELDRLGREMASTSEALRDRLRRLNAHIAHVGWSGPDADRFREDWRGRDLIALNELCTELTKAAEHLKGNAERQRGTSTR